MNELSFRTLAVSTFTAIAFALMSVNISAEPLRLGSGQVPTIAFSPDGAILAASHRTDPESDIYSTQVVILWDPQTHQQVDMLEMLNIYVMAFSPDGTLLALGGDDHKIHLWDVAGRNEVGLMQSPSHLDVTSLVFSPDGKTLASSGGGDKMVHLWDVQSQQQVGTLRGHTGLGVVAIVFSPDGRLIFSGGHRGDEAIRIWDVQAQQQVGELAGHSDVTYDLAFSPDGTILASAGGWNDKAVYLWDVQTQNQVGMLGGHLAHVLSIAFSLNGKILASTVNWDDTIHFWDIEKQEHMGIFEHHDAIDSGWASYVAFSSDGKWLACGSEDGVELWELDRPDKALTELMLLVMSEFHFGNVDAELAWDSLVNVQAALAALDTGNLDEAQAALNALEALITQNKNPRAGRITPEAAAEIVQRATEIIIIVALGQ